MIKNNSIILILLLLTGFSSIAQKKESSSKKPEKSALAANSVEASKAPEKMFYSIKATEVIKSKQDEVLGNDISFEINEGDASWTQKSKIVITDITNVSDYDKFGMNYDDKQISESLIIKDTINKTIEFNLKDFVTKTKVFQLFYDNKPKGKFQFKVIDNTSNSNDVPQRTTLPMDPKTDNTLFKDAYNYVSGKDLKNNGYRKDDRLNVYRKRNTIIIYIDAAGHAIRTPVPTTSERKYIYEIHLIKRKNDLDYDYNVLRPDGGITDAYNIYYPQTITSVNATASGTQPIDASKELEELIFAPIGPYENDFKISLIRKNTKKPDEPETELLGQTVKIAKFYYVSIQGGLLASTLRNPQNITMAILQNGDTTFTADDPTTRGVFSLMAVFYPKGRSFLFPPTGSVFGPERFGIVLGTKIDKDQFENFLGGLQFDFARGGSISFGAHYGRRTVIEGYRHFKFGEEKFSGSIENKVKKEWNLGFFIGANVDVRVFNFLFGSQGSGSSDQ